ncbi:MAG: hypothetical protein LBG83_07535 [Oscillospiraceae bacterium]|jgi:Mn2+/Fe2+ NRAMP family transporter|nr:hypothetical protein [Oscillospiraceae bacterium]
MRLLQEIEWAQWANLITNIAALALFLAGLGVAAWRLHREKQGAAREELDSIEKARATLATLLNAAVGGLVSNAEAIWGPGTGTIKKSAVIAELLRLLPEQYRTLFDADALGALVENGLRTLKEKKS